MSHSVSRPYHKWYDSGRVLLSLWRWSSDDQADLFLDRMDDEQERLRAADMCASRFVNEHWPVVEVSILSPVSGFSSWDVVKRGWEGRERMQAMLREFWRERV